MNSDRVKLLEDYDNPLYKEDLLGLDIVSLFEEMANLLPDKSAIEYEDFVLTYSEVNQQANRIGRALLAQSPLKGETVAALAEISPQMAVMILSVFKARKMIIGLSPDQPLQRLEEIILNSEAKVLVCCNSTSALAENLAENSGIDLINIDDLGYFETDNIGLDYTPSDDLGITYTSGTTGKPKGLVFDNSSSLHALGVHAAMGLDASLRLISIYHFSYGNGVLGPFKAWLLGGSYHPINLPKVGIREMIERIKKEKITLYQSPPSLFRNIGKQIEPGELSTIRWIHLGGEPLIAHDLDLFKKKFDPPCKIFNNYGSSEIGSMARNVMDHSTVLKDDIVPLGLKTARMTLTILGEFGNQVETGQIGEMVVQSRYLKNRYWKNPEYTAKRFQKIDGREEKILHTGDLVYQLPDGSYVFAGRKDSLVKVRGSRVLTVDVEAALAKIKGVDEAVVLANRKPDGDASLIAYVQLGKNISLTSDLIRKALSERLPEYMIPGQMFFMSEFPRTNSGKIDRQNLPEPDRMRPQLSNERVVPTTSIEEKLASIWSRVLNLEGVGITDNFFDLGGDSLVAVELFIEIEKAFHQRMPISLLLEAGNIRQQAVLLGNISDRDHWQPLVPFNQSGKQSPLICFAGKGGNPIKFRQLAASLGDDQPVYFLQSRGLSGREAPHTTMQAIAADFMTAIRDVVPTGPYRLLGSSFGGKVAYEVACQLQESGEEVEFVMMLDTCGPDCIHNHDEKDHPFSQFEELKSFLAKHWRGLWEGSATDRQKYLQYYLDLFPFYVTKWKTRWGEQHEARQRNESLPRAYRDVETANVVASRNFNPSPYSGLVILIKARRRPTGVARKPYLGWDAVDIGDIQIHEVDGEHGNLLLPPYVHQVSEVLLQYLEKSD